jgi:hypothetical protein
VQSSGDKRAFDLFWEKVQEKKETLFDSLVKSINRNIVRSFWSDNYFRGQAESDLQKWQEEINKIAVQRKDIQPKFDTIIDNKKWKWVPGKEALVILLEIDKSFWTKLHEMMGEGKKLSDLVNDREINEFIKSFDET